MLTKKKLKIVFFYASKMEMGLNLMGFNRVTEIPLYNHSRLGITRNKVSKVFSALFEAVYIERNIFFCSEKLVFL